LILLSQPMMATPTFRASERQAPNLNIRRGAIAITVGASLKASLCVVQYM